MQSNISEIVGTIEMFHKGTLVDIGPYGVLRIDLRSDCENQQIIQSILAAANQHFYEDFAVECILTKAIPDAKERIIALKLMGYMPVSFERAHYYARPKDC